MRDWFEFRGIRSDDYNTDVENMSAMPRAQRNVTSVAVHGRDGDLTVSDDTYGTIPYIITCRWPREVSLREVNGWLSGSGGLITSLEPDLKYKARFDSAINPRSLGALWQADLLFIVQPFVYAAQPEVVTLEASGAINNPGTRFSLPIITVYGAGTLTVGNTALVVTATGGESYVVINSEMQECYFGSNNRGNKVVGEFPQLETGLTAVTLGTGITKVEMQGNWRWF